jgi:hypothetical protein
MDHAAAAAKGSKTLSQFGLSETAINQLKSVAGSVVRQIEEVDVPDDVRLEINLGTPSNPDWHDVEHTSPGQAATAV